MSVLTAQRIVERSLLAHANRVAVVDGDRKIKYQLLHERSGRLANAILGLGSDASHPTAILLPNSYEYIEVDVACTRAGVTRVGINERLSPSECQYILEHSEAAVLVTTVDLLDRFDPHTIRSLKGVIVVDWRTSQGLQHASQELLDYEEVLSKASRHLQVPTVTPLHPAYLLYTSGTTGHPKGATHTHSSRVAAMLNMLASELRIDRNSAILHVGSLTHGSGSKVIAFLAVGGTNVIAPKFNPEIFQMALDLGVTHTFLVPTMIQRLVEANSKVHKGVRSLTQISFGGAPIAISLFEQAIEKFGPILTQVYGAAEAPHPLTVLLPEDYTYGESRERALKSAGRASFGSDLRVVDETGQDVESGTVGELLVRGSHLMMGYWLDKAATASTFTDDGWYISGDLVTEDETGLITFMDRKRDLIITGGFNVYPAEVERVLLEHPQIRQCAVVGYPDDEWGESVLAYIVTTRSGVLSEQTVIDWVREHLAGYKKPRRVIFADELPLGSSQKILKKQLRDSLWQGQERQVS